MTNLSTVIFLVIFKMIVMIVWAIEIPSLSASSLSLNVKMGRIQTSLFN